MNITTVSLFLGRFYLDRAGQAVVRMVDAEFEYTYEYQVTLVFTNLCQQLNDPLSPGFDILD